MRAVSAENCLKATDECFRCSVIGLRSISGRRQSEQQRQEREKPIRLTAADWI